MDNSPSFVYSCWNLTSLFKFWKVKLVVNVHVVIMGGTNKLNETTESLPGGENKFCFSLSKTVFTECRWHGDTGREGASPYFLSIHKLSLDVFTCELCERQRGTESRVVMMTAGPGDHPGHTRHPALLTVSRWPPWSHPALLTVSGESRRAGALNALLIPNFIRNELIEHHLLNFFRTYGTIGPTFHC